MVGTSNESDPEMASECIWVFSIPKAISWGPCYKAIAQKSWLPAGEIRQYRRYFHSQTYNMSMFGKKKSSKSHHLPSTIYPIQPYPPNASGTVQLRRASAGHVLSMLQTRGGSAVRGVQDQRSRGRLEGNLGPKPQAIQRAWDCPKGPNLEMYIKVLYIYIYIYLYLYIYGNIYISIYLYIDIMYIFVYTYTYTYILKVKSMMLPIIVIIHIRLIRSGKFVLNHE